jgi:hypothetical protein
MIKKKPITTNKQTHKIRNKYKQTSKKSNNIYIYNMWDTMNSENHHGIHFKCYSFYDFVGGDFRASSINGTRTILPHITPFISTDSTFVFHLRLCYMLFCHFNPLFYWCIFRHAFALYCSLLALYFLYFIIGDTSHWYNYNISYFWQLYSNYNYQTICPRQREQYKAKACRKIHQ